jgi:hypothetical protein
MFVLFLKAEVELKILLALLNFHNGKLGLMVWLAKLATVWLPRKLL